MKVLKWVLGVVLAAVVVLLVGGMLLPGKFQVTRSAMVNAPPDKIFALVADPRRWFAVEGGATRVTWVINGDLGSNPLYHWFVLFAERMTGQDFDAGLAGLMALAEKP